MMSRLAELIGELCPDGVEYRTIEELFDTRNGYTPSRSNPDYWVKEGIPWFRMDDIRTNGNVLDESLEHISPEAVKGGKLFPAGTVIVATSATIGEHALLRVPSLSNQRFTALITKPEFSDLLLPEFVHYYCFVLDDWCLRNTTQSSFASVDMRKFRKFRFPVPPLEVQQEIVRVLDAFTDLEQNLVAELELRGKQYEYYRHELLDFGNSVEWFPLAELAEYVNGKAHERLVSEEGTIPLVTARFISRNGEANRYVKLEDIRTPAQFGDIAMVLSDLPNGRALARTFFVDCDDSYAINQRVARIRVLDLNRIEPRFLYYVLDRNPGLLRYDSGFDQTHLSKRQVTSLKIPLPPLGIQREVVERLDKFSTLVNGMTSGLPAEINLRRKQYEFYRDELLRFTPKED